MDYKNLNKLRAHNKKETIKHFMIKAMVLKVLINANYYVYSEKDMISYSENPKRLKSKTRVADICACSKRNIACKREMIIVEVETKPTKKHNKELIKFYEEYNLYIIDVKDIANNLPVMEIQIKHILGL